MQSLHILILAAGQGKRIKSSLPKVLHPILHKPMLYHVLDLAQSLNPKSISVVVGFGADQVKEACAGYDVQYVSQKEQLGTGHAVQCAANILGKEKGTLLILSGDVVLLEKSTIEAFLSAHEKTKSELTLLSAKPFSPQGYGRILKKSGKLVGIREERDCSTAEKKIGEVNAGIYAFNIPSLFEALSKIGAANDQKEYYLTDTIEILAKAKKKIATFPLQNAEEMLGVNDRAQLNEVEGILRTRINRRWMMEGVTLKSPETITIDPSTRLAADVTIESGCTLVAAEVETGVVIESQCRIIRSSIGRDSQILQGCYFTESKIGGSCKVGPFAHLRPGSVLEEGVKIGNFVEIKKSRFAKGSKANHLSYIGDATIGARSNLGCGFITCNYDGKAKHETVIGEDVFVGSDSQAVAPIKIEKGSYVATGTTITDNVPAYSLVISRGRQINKPGYSKKYAPANSNNEGNVKRNDRATRSIK